MSWFSAVLNRLREPSTWAAISTTALAFGAHDGNVQMAETAVVGATALIAVFMPEHAGD